MGVKKSMPIFPRDNATLSKVHFIAGELLRPLDKKSGAGRAMSAAPRGAPADVDAAGPTDSPLIKPCRKRLSELIYALRDMRLFLATIYWQPSRPTRQICPTALARSSRRLRLTATPASPQMSWPWKESSPSASAKLILSGTKKLTKTRYSVESAKRISREAVLVTTPPGPQVTGTQVLGKQCWTNPIPGPTAAAERLPSAPTVTAAGPLAARPTTVSVCEQHTTSTPFADLFAPL